MFFRLKHSKSGQVLQLLESYRNGQGQPRQRVVISLGNAKIVEKDRGLVAKAIEKLLYGIEELLPAQYTRAQQRWIDSIIKRIDRQGRWSPLRKVLGHPPAKDRIIDGVFFEQVTHTATVMLGPVLLALHVWRELRMPQQLKALGFNRAQIDAATTSVINRLVDPVSENALPGWVAQTALAELLGVGVLGARRDRFYRVSDLLVENQLSIEKHLRDRHGELFNVDRTLLLYDLTNSHFEGACAANPKAKRGKNKQKRNDCAPIVVGMVFNREGFALAHKIFEGNSNDATTLLEMINQLEEMLCSESLRGEQEKPMIIVDAGIATEKNLQLLREKGLRYLVNDTRRGRAIYREEFVKQDGFETIPGRGKKPEVKVRRIPDPRLECASSSCEQGNQQPNAGEEPPVEQLVLCKSQKRRQKELAIRSHSETRFLEALERLGRRVQKAQLKDPVKIQRAIGRIQGQHSRVQRFYQVQLKEHKTATEATVEKTQESLPGQSRNKPVWEIVWERHEQPYEHDDQLLGCYVLRSNVQNLTAPELWQLYMTLTHAEDGFKALKSDLGLRPNRHHLESRVDAHVFITILAYHLLCYIEHILEQQGDTRCWQSIKRVLQTHCYTDPHFTHEQRRDIPGA